MFVHFMSSQINTRDDKMEIYLYQPRLYSERCTMCTHRDTRPIKPIYRNSMQNTWLQQ